MGFIMRLAVAKWLSDFEPGNLGSIRIAKFNEGGPTIEYQLYGGNR